MPNHRETTKILQQAQYLLRNGVFGGFTVRNSGHIEKPIPVLTPDRTLHSWFVPITVGKRLAGFFEFLPDVTLIQYSSFQRQEDSLVGCPAAELWIDVESIRKRINKIKQPGKKISDLFLTYETVPSRLAWAGILDSPDGTNSTVYVAGNAIWKVDL